MTRKAGAAGAAVAAVAAVWLAGCAEQPAGYIYKPDESQVVDLAYITMDVVNVLYQQADEATRFLENAALADDPSAILPAGWVTAWDTTGGRIRQVFIRNYLDQKFNLMSFDLETRVGAVRRPSQIDYRYIQVGSFLNPITAVFYGDLTEDRHLVVEYARNRQDPRAVEGWFKVTRATEFEYRIEIKLQTGENYRYSQTYYEDVTWVIRVEDFSTDPNDQRGVIAFDGVFPQLDREGIRRENHVSGRAEINAAGRGKGQFTLNSVPAFELRFFGRQGSGFIFKLDLL